jgi:hypothetical protein
MLNLQTDAESFISLDYNYRYFGSSLMFDRKLTCVFAMIVLVSVACAQGPMKRDRRSTDELLDALNEDDGHTAGPAGFLIDRGDDPRTIPALKRFFQRAATKNNKQVAAMALIRLGLTDSEYFEYLASFAKEAVESDAPSFLPPTPPAQLQIGQPRPKLNPEFEAWCLVHGKEMEEEMRKQWTEYPTDVMVLAHAGDPRAAPIFRKGLNSQNGQIVIASASGLAEIGDLADIPLLVQASYQRGNNDIFFTAALLTYAKRGNTARQAVLRAVQGSKLYDAYVLEEKAAEAALRVKGQ